MKKVYVIIPALLLAACSRLTGEYQQDEFFYEDEAVYASEDEYALADEAEIVSEDTGLVVDANFVADAPLAVPEEQPQVMGAGVETIKTPETTLTVSEDGTKITIPAQEIYIEPQTDIVAPESQSTSMPMAYSSPYQMPPEPMAQPKPAWITLQNRQHPNTFVQCLSTDMACVALHEQQGYIRVQNLPQFAGYQDILGVSDYPGEGQWRNGNNIPRW